MATLAVTIPDGVAAGTLIQVQGPEGLIQVQVPQGMQPGQVFHVQAVQGASADGSAVDENDYEPYQPLPEKRFDLTDPFESFCACVFCPCAGWTTKHLILQDQEVFLRIKNNLQSSKQRRPYAQLGSVDKHSTACGCYTLSSDFAPVNEKGEGGLKAGLCGMDGDTIEAVVQELQTRKKIRGGIGQIRKLDYVLGKAAKVGTQVPLLAQKLGIAIPKKVRPQFNKEPLPTKVIDVSGFLDPICLTTKTLRLEAEEAHMEISVCGGCNSINTKREYGELGFVEKQKSCICCFRVSSDISPIPGQSDMMPGIPCANRAQVNVIVRELRERMAKRGQVGQIKKQEQILSMISNVEEQMLAMKDNLGLPFPPPEQELMKKFGEHPPKLGVPIVKEEAPPVVEYDVTNEIDSCLTCCCTCGAAGFTKESVRLDGDYMYVNSKNNFDDSNMMIPYAEIDSVDISKSCCCCWSVNDQSPGYGCSGAEVQRLAANLQERKVKRGNIAHLQQLRKMQANAVGLDIIAEQMCNKEGIQYPPTQETMAEVWKGKTPRGLTLGADHVHLEPDKEFEAKTYNVTNIPDCLCNFLCSCGLRGCLRNTLELGPDEVLLVREDLCSRSSSRTPYGNLGSVETEETCFCCHELPDVATPGFGCSKDLVDEIAKELQERKVMRGNIAHMKQQ
eukprot:TRINITY_DN22035_c0_g1_i2.p1 TRINITY_DN22035_c0_g1~~TRINITY_DN22035_c0_g1_i2.p1  ORF type:complete len:699 (-),score=74.54 TRINITY_DN22035_c0_g1_i2:400-2421(-)